MTVFTKLALLGLAAMSAGQAAGVRIHKELYTTNAICRRRYCVNPIFPGLEDLHSLSEAKWVAASLQEAQPTMSFCRGAVNYNPAVPAPSGGAGAKLADLVKKQEQAAITMYGFHLAGMGIEMWDHTRPSEDSDDCVKSVWRMVCYSYFPKAAVGKKPGEETEYMRPCQSSCQNYIRSCGVECCDESVQCVFEHTKTISATEAVKTTGYEPHDGPSSLCTGSARSSTKTSLPLLLALLFVHLSGLRVSLHDFVPSRRVLKNV